MRYTGYVLFISGTLLFGIMHLAIAVLLSNTPGIAPPGLISNALESIAGQVPYVLSIILMVLGLILIVVNSKWWEKQKKEFKERDHKFSEEHNKRD